MNIFYLISLSGIAGFFICACFVREGTLFNWLMMEHRFDYELSDFFRQIGYSSDLKNVYFEAGGGRDSPFPALAYVFFHFLYMINPVHADMKTWLLKGYTIDYEPIILVMWTILNVMILLYFIQKITKFSFGEAVFFTCVLMFSSPYFSGALERGNPVLFTVLILCAALFFLEQDERWQKELALILIACAAGFKVLPCFMGLLYIREHRYREAVHLIIYGIILVLLPFYFTGGWASFVKFVKNIYWHGKIHNLSWTSFPGFMRYWLHMFTGTRGKVFEAVIRGVIQLIFFLSMIYFTFRTKYHWKAVLYLSMIMAYIHANSYRYYTIYLTLPLLLMISKTEDLLSKNLLIKINLYVYYVLFALIFTIQIWGINGDIERWMCAPAYLLCIYSMIEDIFVRV